MNASLFVVGSQVLASEAAGEAAVPAWVFGLTALGILGGLLVITMMIKVDR